MRTFYQIDGFLKFTEEDKHDEGCLPDTGSTYMVEAKFTGSTVKEVIEKAAKFLNIDADGIEKDACDEKGRIDFAGMECDDNTTPSKAELASWKQGKTRLWYVVYSAHIEKVARVSAN